MLTLNDKWDKISLLFAIISITAYWLIIFNGLLGVILSLINSFFWILYFNHKNSVSQILIHISYQIANILYIIHYWRLL